MRVEFSSGSTLWQTIFVSFAVVVILLEVLRGWRLGLPRQLVRLFAFLAAYAAAIFGGRWLLPLIRPLLELPDIALLAIGGAALAVVVYVTLTTAGAFVFKPTRAQTSGTVRLLWGLSGAALGVFFGAFTIWLVIVGIRSLGTIADARPQMLESPAPPRAVRAARAPYLAGGRSSAAANEEPMLDSLARLKNSIEMGRLGDAVKTTDVIPSGTYVTLGKIGQVASNPHVAQRFLSYPGAGDLSENSRIVALRDDPDIAELIKRGHFIELLQNRRVIEALNDPALIERVKSFEFQKALDYALEKQ